MNVVRSYSNEGKTLQELMEILLPIYLQEKTCNKEIEELEFKTQNPNNLFSYIDIVIMSYYEEGENLAIWKQV